MNYLWPHVYSFAMKSPNFFDRGYRLVKEEEAIPKITVSLWMQELLYILHIKGRSSEKSQERIYDFRKGRHLHHISDMMLLLPGGVIFISIVVERIH